MYLLWIILVLVVLFGFHISLVLIEGNTWNIHNILRFIWIPLLLMSVSTIGWIVLQELVGKMFNDADYEKSAVVHEIISIGDGSNVEGSFLLGSGTIKDNMVYTYYRKSDKNDGGIIRKMISENLTTIYESDTVTVPTIHIDIIPKYNNDNWFSFNRNGNHQKYRIYLPKNSIIRNINLNNN